MALFRRNRGSTSSGSSCGSNGNTFEAEFDSNRRPSGGGLSDEVAGAADFRNLSLSLSDWIGNVPDLTLSEITEEGEHEANKAVQESDSDDFGKNLEGRRQRGDSESSVDDLAAPCASLPREASGELESDSGCGGDALESPNQGCRFRRLSMTRVNDSLIDENHELSDKLREVEYRNEQLQKRCEKQDADLQRLRTQIEESEEERRAAAARNESESFSKRHSGASDREEGPCLRGKLIQEKAFRRASEYRLQVVQGELQEMEHAGDDLRELLAYTEAELNKATASLEAERLSAQNGLLQWEAEKAQLTTQVKEFEAQIERFILERQQVVCDSLHAQLTQAANATESFIEDESSRRTSTCTFSQDGEADEAEDEYFSEGAAEADEALAPGLYSTADGPTLVVGGPIFLGEKKLQGVVRCIDSAQSKAGLWIGVDLVQGGRDSYSHADLSPERQRPRPPPIEVSAAVTHDPEDTTQGPQSWRTDRDFVKLNLREQLHSVEQVPSEGDTPKCFVCDAEVSQHICCICSQGVCPACSASRVEVQGCKDLQRACSICIAQVIRGPAALDRARELARQLQTLAVCVLTNTTGSPAVPSQILREPRSMEEALGTSEVALSTISEAWALAPSTLASDAQGALASLGERLHDLAGPGVSAKGQHHALLPGLSDRSPVEEVVAYCEEGLSLVEVRLARADADSREAAHRRPAQNDAAVQAEAPTPPLMTEAAAMQADATVLVEVAVQAEAPAVVEAAVQAELVEDDLPLSPAQSPRSLECNIPDFEAGTFGQWAADAPKCSLCQAKLGKTKGRPRHHCRICGECVCHACSKSTVQLSGQRGLHRACNNCIAQPATVLKAMDLCHKLRSLAMAVTGGDEEREEEARHEASPSSGRPPTSVNMALASCDEAFQVVWNHRQQFQVQAVDAERAAQTALTRGQNQQEVHATGAVCTQNILESQPLPRIPTGEITICCQTSHEYLTKLEGVADDGTQDVRLRPMLRSLGADLALWTLMPVSGGLFKIASARQPALLLCLSSASRGVYLREEKGVVSPAKDALWSIRPAGDKDGGFEIVSNSAQEVLHRAPPHMKDSNGRPALAGPGRERQGAWLLRPACGILQVRVLAWRGPWETQASREAGVPYVVGRLGTCQHNTVPSTCREGSSHIWSTDNTMGFVVRESDRALELEIFDSTSPDHGRSFGRLQVDIQKLPEGAWIFRKDNSIPESEAKSGELEIEVRFDRGDGAASSDPDRRLFLPEHVSPRSRGPAANAAQGLPATPSPRPRRGLLQCICRPGVRRA